MFPDIFDLDYLFDVVYDNKKKKKKDIYVMYIPFLLGMNHFGDSDGLEEPMSFLA